MKLKIETSNIHLKILNKFLEFFIWLKNKKKMKFYQISIRSLSDDCLMECLQPHLVFFFIILIF